MVPPRWSVVALLLAAGLAGCLSAAHPSDDSRQPWVASLTSPRWDAYLANASPTAPTLEAAASQDGPQDPPYPGPAWKVGETEEIHWGLVSHAAPLEDFHLALVLPEGWRAVDGPTEFNGTIGSSGVHLATLVRAETPGLWAIRVEGSSHGEPYEFPGGGRNFFVGER